MVRPSRRKISGLSLLSLLLLLWVPILCVAGGPPKATPSSKQMWIQDTVRTTTEQQISKGELLKELRLSLDEEIEYGKVLIEYGKALMEVPMLPFLTLVGLVFGVLKVFERWVFKR